MRKLIIASVLFALAGCASSQEVAQYAAQECAALKTSGTQADYDRCLIERREFCAKQSAEGNFLGCRP